MSLQCGLLGDFSKSVKWTIQSVDDLMAGHPSGHSQTVTHISLLAENCSSSGKKAASDSWLRQYLPPRKKQTYKHLSDDFLQIFD